MPIPSPRVALAALPILATALLCGCGGGGGAGASGQSMTQAQAPLTDTVDGSVTFNGTAMSGITVIAFNTNTNSVFGTTVTDATGHYRFTGLGTGCTNNCVQNYQFWPTKAGFGFTPQAAGGNGSRNAYQWDPSSGTWYVNAGAAVTRAGYNGQFTNAGGGAGLIFTVQNFNAVAGTSASGANFSGFDGSNAPVRLAASAQTLSYAPGDDAALHAGVAWPVQRYSDNQDGTVTDQLTGLIWLKDAGCLQPALWADAIAAVNALASGSCGLSDASSAGQWRMPNLWELESLVDESANQPALSPGSPFSGVSSTPYWSSTSYYGGVGGSPQAWAIRLADGRYINDSVTNVKASSRLGVWAVRTGGAGAVRLQATGFYVHYVGGDDGTVEAGIPLPFPRMRDNGNGTVTDTLTGLTWLRQADCIHQTWAVAVAAVNALGDGQCGLSDGSAPGAWRMPNRKEMASLADRAQNNQADFFTTAWTSATAPIPSLAAPFTGFIQFQYYWTSTTDAADPNSAWTVFSCDFGIYDTPKSASGYTLAVR